MAKGPFVVIVVASDIQVEDGLNGQVDKRQMAVGLTQAPSAIRLGLLKRLRKLFKEKVRMSVIASDN